MDVNEATPRANRLRLPALETLAILDHERACRDEPPWPYLSVSHRLVHENAALRERRRLESVR
jgi:hypothetical protein